uniref:SecY-independent protein translocase component TatA n=1 Tax=Reclinomonas americana TaxID=48483 RepID=O21292_RECAM|nr:SecY-independent protein translocase component TatA [Reclinomonas americana]AAD11922.1 SecY-independent protein translocase component TatA [Reclinomonas americana]
MSIGLGQILVIIIVIIFLFGRFPTLSKNLTDGLDNIRSYLEQKKEVSSNEKLDSSIKKEENSKK